MFAEATGVEIGVGLWEHGKGEGLGAGGGGLVICKMSAVSSSTSLASCWSLSSCASLRYSPLILKRGEIKDGSPQKEWTTRHLVPFVLELINLDELLLGRT